MEASLLVETAAAEENAGHGDSLFSPHFLSAAEVLRDLQKAPEFSNHTVPLFIRKMSSLLERA